MRGIGRFHFLLVLSAWCSFVVLAYAVPGQIVQSGATLCVCETGCLLPPTGSIGWWPGDGNAHDIQLGSNGILMNGASFAPGLVGQAFSFDGVNAFVDVPDTPALHVITTAVTVDAWINPQVPPAGQGWIFARRDPGVSEGVSLFVSKDGSLVLVLRTSAVSVLAPAVPVIQFNGEWQHVAVTADTSTGQVHLYLNGNPLVLVGPPPVSGPFASVSHLFIGQRQSSDTPEGAGGGGHYNGLIDEVEVYNRALSAAEIRAIFSVGARGKCKVTNEPPVANAGPDQTVECASHTGSTVTLNGSASSDPNGGTLSFRWTDENNNVKGTTAIVNNVTVPLGTHTFTLKVTNLAGLSSTAVTHVTVRDTIPPTLSVSLTPNVLWPPNHKFVPIAANIQVSDTCDPSPRVVLVSIASNEPGVTGDVQGAVFGTDVRSFLLRAERSGTGTGRIYTMTFRVIDASGNMSFASATVTVPHDQREP